VQVERKAIVDIQLGYQIRIFPKMARNSLQSFDILDYRFSLLCIYYLSAIGMITIGFLLEFKFRKISFLEKEILDFLLYNF